MTNQTTMIKCATSVMTIVDSDIFLRGDGSVHHVEWVVMDTFSEAALSAWGQEWRSDLDEDALTWTDLRQKMFSIWTKDRFNNHVLGSNYRFISDLYEDVFHKVKPKVPCGMQRALDDVVADIYNCMKVRSVVGSSSSFWERVLDVYTCGAWPCGWSSTTIDEGNLKVFFPLKSDA